MAIACTALFAPCSSNAQGNNNKSESLIGKASPTIQNGIMTPEVLHSFGRIGNVQVSPTNKQLLYQVTYVDIEQNKTNTELFTMKADGSDKTQLTHTNDHISNAQWIDGGNKIAFLKNYEGANQLWEMNADGSNPQRISNVEGGIEGFTYSPNQTKVMNIKKVKSTKTASDHYPDLPQASGRIIDDLMYKHWDHWVESIPHTFYATLENGQLVNHVDLLEGKPYQAPLLPFGGVGDLAWSADSKSIV